jgi:glycine/D-amino acid oxidase-like deaminating enzyme
VHTLSEAQADPPTAKPSRVAVDEKQITVDGEKKWLYANTPDNGFIIDQVGPKGCYALVGAGHAFKHGPIIGQLAADLVVDGESDLFALNHFSIDRFEITRLDRN